MLTTYRISVAMVIQVRLKQADTFYYTIHYWALGCDENEFLKKSGRMLEKEMSYF